MEAGREAGSGYGFGGMISPSGCWAYGMSVFFYATAKHAQRNRHGRAAERRCFSCESGGFREALAKVFWNALLNEISQEARQRRSDGNKDPEERREHESGYGYCLKRDG